jgi:hypothetical protein
MRAENARLIARLCHVAAATDPRNRASAAEASIVVTCLADDIETRLRQQGQTGQQSRTLQGAATLARTLRTAYAAAAGANAVKEAVRSAPPHLSDAAKKVGSLFT